MFSDIIAMISQDVLQSLCLVSIFLTEDGKSRKFNFMTGINYIFKYDSYFIL